MYPYIIMGVRGMQPDKNKGEKTREELYHVGRQQESMSYEIKEIYRTIRHLKARLMLYTLLIVVLVIVFVIIVVYLYNRLDILSNEVANLSKK